MRAPDAVPDGRSDTWSITLPAFPRDELSTTDTVDFGATGIYVTVAIIGSHDEADPSSSDLLDVKIDAREKAARTLTSEKRKI